MKHLSKPLVGPATPSTVGFFHEKKSHGKEPFIEEQMREAQAFAASDSGEEAMPLSRLAEEEIKPSTEIVIDMEPPELEHAMRFYKISDLDDLTCCAGKQMVGMGCSILMTLLLAMMAILLNNYYSNHSSYTPHRP
jgi:hypothetical protein